MIALAVNAIVKVEGDNIDYALKLLKKKVGREGLVREIKRHTYYEKPTEVRRKKLLKARRKQQKLIRKLKEKYKYY
ncbi:30S ribosomal protein S21 [Deferribacter thermophilus]|uniref:30S ribosomal protein S21 n=1 Tax=Deferribacter thermophilus TaxID=53573 RepID=UPI003C187B25